MVYMAPSALHGSDRGKVHNDLVMMRISLLYFGDVKPGHAHRKTLLAGEMLLPVQASQIVTVFDGFLEVKSLASTARKTPDPAEKDSSGDSTGPGPSDTQEQQDDVSRAVGVCRQSSSSNLSQLLVVNNSRCISAASRSWIMGPSPWAPWHLDYRWTDAQSSPCNGTGILLDR